MTAKATMKSIRVPAIKSRSAVGPGNNITRAFGAHVGGLVIAIIDRYRSGESDACCEDCEKEELHCGVFVGWWNDACAVELQWSGVIRNPLETGGGFLITRGFLYRNMYTNTWKFRSTA